MGGWRESKVVRLVGGLEVGKRNRSWRKGRL